MANMTNQQKIDAILELAKGLDILDIAELKVFFSEKLGRMINEAWDKANPET